MENDNTEYIYPPSSSSDEDWGDDSWEVDGIIGEHINTRGERRYQVAWSGWTRSDGTNWTWEKPDGTTLGDLSGMLKRWRKEKYQKLQQRVVDPLVSPFHPCELPEGQDTCDEKPEPELEKKRKNKLPVMYAFTELAHQTHQLAVDLRGANDFEHSASLASAFDRLQEMRQTRDAALESFEVTLPEAVGQYLCELGPASIKDARQKNMPLHRRMESLNVSDKITKPSGTVGSPVPGKQPAVLPASIFNFVLDVNEQPGSYDYGPKRPSRPLPRRPPSISRTSASVKVQAGQSTASGLRASSFDDTLPRAPSVGMSLPRSPYVWSGIQSMNDTACVVRRVQSSTPSPREALQAKWSAAVEAAGAAPVTIVNDINDDEVPDLEVESFTYLESDYIYGLGVTRSQGEFMESCDCSVACEASSCTCQDDVEIQDEDGQSKSFPYDANGLYTFSTSIMNYVIECNKDCLCDVHCPSRVAQRPRTFPIEVFRTERYGWGARSTVALPKGRVLGVYTGELLAREPTQTYSVERASYLADLDFMVSGPQKGYSVDAYNCGNWTRFVNHSCNPVCVLYSVIWDSVPAMHQPKLAFVAKTDIPARTELTIDYCPQARKGKGKAPRRNGPACVCGTKDCRGFIFLK